MKSEKKVSKLTYFMAKEAGIELKAALYFWCILFFYSAFRILQGNWEASIIHLFEMIFTTYVMGYLQMYMFSNFDESENFTWKTLLYSGICSGLYVAVAYVFRWFETSVAALAVFFIYILIAYVCAWWMYKIKRIGDTKALNEDLKAFQERSRANGEDN